MATRRRFDVFGYGAAQGLVQVLKQCGDDLTRENIMKQAANLDFELGIYLPGTRSRPARPTLLRSSNCR